MKNEDFNEMYGIEEVTEELCGLGNIVMCTHCGDCYSPVVVTLYNKKK